MQQAIFLCLALLMVVSFVILLAEKIGVAYPILLVVAGIGVSFVPGLPNVKADPNIVFLILLPPILFDAARNSSWKAIWKWRRIITVMALGYVLLTSTAVAFISCWLIPGLNLSEGFLLGAIISPPDASAATAVLQKLKLPKGLVCILDGESLLNDATSLTIFRFALAAVVSGKFVWYNALGTFALVTFSGILIGLIIGLIFYGLYKWLPTTSNLDIALSFVLPYLSYTTANYFDSSGVLSVVSSGLFMAYHNHFLHEHNSRLKSNAVWPSFTFILNAVVFFLIGIQCPAILGVLKEMPVMEALRVSLIISMVIIGVRLLAGHLAAMFTTFISKYITVAVAHPGWRNPMIISWAGMRGVVSLASALSIPLMTPDGQAFPYRSLILFITFTVIIITLAGQGLALPWLIKVIKPEKIPGELNDDDQLLAIEQELFNAALKKMKRDFSSEVPVNHMIKNRLDMLSYKVAEYENLHGDRKKIAVMRSSMKRFNEVVTEVTEHQRQHLSRFRHDQNYDEDIIRIIEKRLDLEEERTEDNID